MNEMLAPQTGLFKRVGLFFRPVPLLGYLFGFLACVLLEQLAGDALTSLLGLPKMPVLFGLLTIFKVLAGVVNLLIKGDVFDWATLVHIPTALIYFIVIYLIPMAAVARAVVKPANTLANKPISMVVILKHHRNQHAKSEHLRLKYPDSSDKS